MLLDRGWHFCVPFPHPCCPQTLPSCANTLGWPALCFTGTCPGHPGWGLRYMGFGHCPSLVTLHSLWEWKVSSLKDNNTPFFSHTEQISRGVNKEHAADQEEFLWGKKKPTRKIQDIQTSQPQGVTEKESLSKLEKWGLLSALCANRVQPSVGLRDSRTSFPRV